MIKRKFGRGRSRIILLNVKKNLFYLFSLRYKPILVFDKVVNWNARVFPLFSLVYLSSYYISLIKIKKHYFLWYKDKKRARNKKKKKALRWSDWEELIRDCWLCWFAKKVHFGKPWLIKLSLFSFHSIFYYFISFKEIWIKLKSIEYNNRFVLFTIDSQLFGPLLTRL